MNGEMKMPYCFSPSSLSLLRDCPRCFWLLFNRGVKRPSGLMPSLPNGMDRVLKAHFDSFRDQHELPPELVHLNGEIKLFEEKELLDDWRNYKKGLQWLDSNGNKLVGAVDNVLQKGNKLIVLDYKTRGFPIKEDSHEYYREQMDLYTFLLQKNGFPTESYAYLLFYHPTRVEKNGDLHFHHDLIKIDVHPENAPKTIKKALELLAEPEPKPDENCEYCKMTQHAQKTEQKRIAEY